MAGPAKNVSPKEFLKHSKHLKIYLIIYCKQYTVSVKLEVYLLFCCLDQSGYSQKSWENQAYYHFEGFSPCERIDILQFYSCFVFKQSNENGLYQVEYKRVELYDGRH